MAPLKESSAPLFASLSDFAGGKNGKFFKIVPGHVSLKKAAGTSPIPPPTFKAWLWYAVTLRHVWASPNTVWSVMALAMYFLMPYDLSPSSSAARAPLSWAFFAERFPLWAGVFFAYTGFWHLTLHWMGWADRPFIKNRLFNADKVAHNIFWSITGLVQWTAFENVFSYLWASGRLPYLTDAEAFSTPAGFARFALGLVAIPLWRDAHFYFAHRVLHIESVYSMVHSLHHRNQDIEPFAGLSMHPVEHLCEFFCAEKKLGAQLATSHSSAHPPPPQTTTHASSPISSSSPPPSTSSGTASTS